MQISVFENEIKKIYNFVKNSGAVKLDDTGKILPQNFVISDIGFISFPPFIKKIIEYGAVHFDGLPLDSVVGEIMFYQTAKGYSYLPNVRNLSSSQSNGSHLLSVTRLEKYLDLVNFSEPILSLNRNNEPEVRITENSSSNTLLFYLFLAMNITR